MIIGAYLLNSIRKMFNKKLITNHLNKNQKKKLFFVRKLIFLCNVEEKKVEWKIHSLIEWTHVKKATLRTVLFHIFMNDCTNKLTNEHTHTKKTNFLTSKTEWKILLLRCFFLQKFKISWNERSEKNVIISWWSTLLGNQ